MTGTNQQAAREACIAGMDRKIRALLGYGGHIVETKRTAWPVDVYVGFRNDVAHAAGVPERSVDDYRQASA